jgi:hypothetical protein
MTGQRGLFCTRHTVDNSRGARTTPRHHATRHATTENCQNSTLALDFQTTSKRKNRRRTARHPPTRLARFSVYMYSIYLYSGGTGTGSTFTFQDSAVESSALHVNDAPLNMHNITVTQITVYFQYRNLFSCLAAHPFQAGHRDGRPKVKGDRGNTYEVTMKPDHIYCTCPGWRFMRAPIQARRCKHVQRLLAGSPLTRRIPLVSGPCHTDPVMWLRTCRACGGHRPCPRTHCSLSSPYGQATAPR